MASGAASGVTRQAVEPEPRVPSASPIAGFTVEVLGAAAHEPFEGDRLERLRWHSPSEVDMGVHLSAVGGVEECAGEHLVTETLVGDPVEVAHVPTARVPQVEDGGDHALVTAVEARGWAAVARISATPERLPVKNRLRSIDEPSMGLAAARRGAAPRGLTSRGGRPCDRIAETKSHFQVKARFVKFGE